MSHLASRLNAHQAFTTTVPVGAVTLPRSAQFCLLLGDRPVPTEWDDDAESGAQLSPERFVVAIGRVRASPRPQTTDERLHVSEPHVIEPVKVTDLVAGIPRDLQKSGLNLLKGLGGAVHAALGNMLIASLINIRPSLQELIATLWRNDQVSPIGGAAGSTLALERDAAHLALSICGISTESINNWAEPDSNGFLGGLRGYQPYEDVLLAHDATRFPSWDALAGGRPDWITFSDGDQHIRVGNVNRTPLERVLGVDLIYRHLEADTFVLVQYKRMLPGPRKGWSYTPDEQLDKELDRMRKIDTGDNSAENSPTTWRLHPRGCYLKLVRAPREFNPNDTQLLSGIYLPLEYLDELWLSRPTGRGSRTLGYENIDRYLTGELFISLVRQGWIGTRGVATRAIEAIVNACISEGHSVVLAEEWGDAPGSMRRRGRPRQ